MWHQAVYSQSVSSRTDFHTHYWYLFYLTIATLYYRYLDARSRDFSFICETTIITFISQCGTFFCRKLKKWCWPQNKNISSKLKWQLRIYFYWGWHYNKYFSVLCLSLFHSLLLVLSLWHSYFYLSMFFWEEFLLVTAEVTLGGLGSLAASEVSIPLSPSSAWGIN